MLKTTVAFLAALLACSALADGHGDKPDPTVEKIKAAIAHERRPEADRTRDANRKPLETLVEPFSCC